MRLRGGLSEPRRIADEPSQDGSCKYLPSAEKWHMQWAGRWTGLHLHILHVRVIGMGARGAAKRLASRGRTVSEADNCARTPASCAAEHVSLLNEHRLSREQHGPACTGVPLLGGFAAQAEGGRERSAIQARVGVHRGTAKQ
jgi:hypothetical protein